MGHHATGIFCLFLLTACASWVTGPDASSGFAGWPTQAEATPRSAHEATLLADGRILVTGGSTTPRRADLFDPYSGEWTRVADMPSDYSGHVAALLPDGRVFVYGGLRHGTALSHAAIYDPAADVWTGGVIQEYVDGRRGHSVDILPDGRVFIAGGDHMGSSSLTHTDRARTCDPTLSAHWLSYEVYLEQPIHWQCLPRVGHRSATLPDGSIMLIGGAFSTSVLNETERFDPAEEAFNPLAGMIFERVAHTATELHDGRILVVGGSGRVAFDAPQWGRCEPPSMQVIEPPPEVGVGIEIGIELPFPPVGLPPAPREPMVSVLGTAEVYDPATDTWSQVGSMHHPRLGHVAELLPDGRVVVVGGVDDDGAVPWVETFDPATHAWTDMEPMAVNRGGHSVTVLPDGVVVVIGGADESVNVGLVEIGRFDPSGGPRISHLGVD